MTQTDHPKAAGTTRRQFVAGAAALGVTASSAGALLAACGSDDGSSGGPAPMDTTLPSELTVYGWFGYVSPKVLKSFEKQTGVKVAYTEFNSIPEALDKLQGGAVYDVVWSSSAYLQAFIAAGLLQPLDMSQLKNFANVTDPSLSAPTYDAAADGKKYSAPYMFGTTGFAVRLDKINQPTDSVEMLWDPKYKGEIGMLDDSGEVMTVGLIAAGLPGDSSDQASIDKAKEKLIEQRPLVKKYKSSDITADIKAGLALRHCWDGDAILAINDMGLSKVRYVLPREGFAGWADTMCVHAKAPSAYAAHLFIDYLLDSKVAGENANFTGYQPAPSTADPYIKSLVQRAMRPSPDVLAKATWTETSAETTAAMEEAFAEVKSS